MSRLESKENVQKFKGELKTDIGKVNTAISRLESKENVQEQIAGIKTEISNTALKAGVVPWLVGISALLILLNIGLVVYILMSRGQ